MAKPDLMARFLGALITWVHSMYLGHYLETNEFFFRLDERRFENRFTNFNGEHLMRTLLESLLERAENFFDLIAFRGRGEKCRKLTDSRSHPCYQNNP